MSNEFVQLSLTPLIIGILSAVACALPGNFLLLRKQALIGDAISHVVLPGIVVAFLVTGQKTAWPMMIGAALAAIFAVLLIEITKKLGDIEPGAAMGVIFTALFAGGVLLLEQSDTSSVHLDVEHALHGNLESLVWLSAEGWHSLYDLEALAELPHQVLRLFVVLLLVIGFLFLFWKELSISTFDVAFAKSIGIRTDILGFSLVLIVSIAAVAAFDAVGSIIVIAMFVCPPATARLLTNKLFTQVLLSVIFAILSAVTGYIFAGYGPIWFGLENGVSAAGMIATVSGVFLGGACLFGPCRRKLLEHSSVS